MRQSSDHMIKQALFEQMEQELSGVPSGEQIRRQHIFSRQFEERMKPILAAGGAVCNGKACEAKKRKRAGSGKNIRVLAACIACVLVLGAAFGAWKNLRPFQSESVESGAGITANESGELSGNASQDAEGSEAPGNFSQDEGSSEMPGGASQDTGESENEAPVRMTVTEVTSVSATILMENRSDQYFWYGDAYHLEQWDAEKGVWEPVPESDSCAWEDLAYHLPAGDSSEWRADWTARYGALTPGTYRMVKEVYEGQESSREYTVAAEFSLEGTE